MSIETLWIILFIVSCGNFFFSLFRTYYNWRTLKESREYWGSWKIRQVDIAKKVIEGLGEDELIELAKKVEEIKNNRR